jgi:ribosomal protein S10
MEIYSNDLETEERIGSVSKSHLLSSSHGRLARLPENIYRVTMIYRTTMQKQEEENFKTTAHKLHSVA